MLPKATELAHCGKRRPEVRGGLFKARVCFDTDNGAISLVPDQDGGLSARNLCTIAILRAVGAGDASWVSQSTEFTDIQMSRGCQATLETVGPSEQRGK
jgi:hypothetical protein